MKISLCALLGVFFPVIALGTEQPEWTQKTPLDDGDYFYFVGFGEDQSLSSAKKLADEDARRKIVQQFTGIYSEFSQRSEETTHEFASSRSSEIQSDLIQIRGLKEIESYQNSEKNREQIYILYGFPRGDADALRSTISSRSQTNLSMVAISSTPSGASVRINGKSIGVTPLKIFLPPGKVIAVLFLEGYKSLKKNLYIEMNKDLHVGYVLNLLTGNVIVRCIPTTSHVEWNGNSVQDYSTFEVPAGKYKLQISNDGSKTLVRTGTLDAGKTKEFCLTLEDLSDGATSKVGDAPVDTLQDQVDRAFHAAESGDYEKALEVARLIGIHHPHEPIIHAIRAQVFVYTRFYSKAFREEKSYVDATDDVAEKMKARAFLCYISGMDAQMGGGSSEYVGKKVCIKSIEESPMSPMAHMGMALHFEKEEKLEEARNGFITAALLDSKFQREKEKFCHRNRHSLGFRLRRRC